jgi:hypothetical protein
MKKLARPDSRTPPGDETKPAIKTSGVVTSAGAAAVSSTAQAGADSSDDETANEFVTYLLQARKKLP